MHADVEKKDHNFTFKQKNFILIIHYIIMYYLKNTGLKVFGGHREESVKKELMQIHMVDTFKC